MPLEPPPDVVPYQSPQDEPPPPKRPAESVGGCLIAVVGVPIVGVVAGAATYGAGGLPAWRACVIVAAALAAPLALGLSLRNSRRWHALAAGLLVGVGLAALLGGICFLSLVR